MPFQSLEYLEGLSSESLPKKVPQSTTSSALWQGNVVREICCPDTKILLLTNSAPKNRTTSRTWKEVSSTILCLVRLLSPPIDKLFSWLPINGKMLPIFKQLLIAQIGNDWKGEGISVYRESFPVTWGRITLEEMQRRRVPWALCEGKRIDENWYNGHQVTILFNRNKCNRPPPVVTDQTGQ